MFVLREKNIDIVKDYEFNESNKIYRVVLIDLQRKGFEGIDYYFLILGQNLQKLCIKDILVFDLINLFGLK